MGREVDQDEEEPPAASGSLRQAELARLDEPAGWLAGPQYG